MIYHIQTQQEIVKVTFNMLTGTYLVFCDRLADFVLKCNTNRWLFIRQVIEDWHTQTDGLFLLVYTPPQGAGETVTVPLPPFTRQASVKRYNGAISIRREKTSRRNLKRFSGYYDWNDITDFSRARLLRLLDSDQLEKYAYTDFDGWRETKVEEYCFDCDPDVEIPDEPMDYEPRGVYISWMDNPKYYQFAAY